MFDREIKSKDGVFTLKVRPSNYDHRLSLGYDVAGRGAVSADLTVEQAKALRDALDTAVRVQELLVASERKKTEAVAGIDRATNDAVKIILEEGNAPT